MAYASYAIFKLTWLFTLENNLWQLYSINSLGPAETQKDDACLFRPR